MYHHPQTALSIPTSYPRARARAMARARQTHIIPKYLVILPLHHLLYPILRACLCAIPSPIILLATSMVLACLSSGHVVLLPFYIKLHSSSSPMLDLKVVFRQPSFSLTHSGRLALPNLNWKTLPVAFSKFSH